ncbi:thioredoxin [Thiohalobacter sp. IOR34]|uniref:thioredoxin n=1 Tax=Thiohalobacter sp. IOR34 TaxID=3057176 RepID=UPI0025AF9CD5|nr:thioredoxin [Thiohalobacter sp. IOR34]WJW74754.1 thioredoxin [Thiohalobacter sp. IOR34]
MTDSAYLFEVTREDFPQRVIEASHEGPVLVDFWAEWCAPCQMQLPILSRLAEEFGGKLRVAKVNTDEQAELATEHGIRSIPTLKLYRHGEVVEEMMGVQSESALRAVIDAYLDRESDRIREQAREKAAAGDPEEALALLRLAAGEDPDNPRVLLDLASLALDQGLLEEAESALQSLPREQRDGEEARRLRIRLDLARQRDASLDRAALEARLAKDPDDLEAREQLAILSALEGDHASALEHYLEILRQDRGFHDEAGRRGLLAVFELLGNQGELVGRYRRQMFNLLH